MLTTLAHVVFSLRYISPVIAIPAAYPRLSTRDVPNASRVGHVNLGNLPTLLVDSRANSRQPVDNPRRCGGVIDKARQPYRQQSTGYRQSYRHVDRSRRRIPYSTWDKSAPFLRYNTRMTPYPKRCWDISREENWENAAVWEINP